MPTIFAAFESQQAVTAALNQLLAHGFTSADINVQADEEFRNKPPVAEAGAGFRASVGEFLSKFRQSDQKLPPALFEETLRRGGVVVGVDTRTDIERTTAQVVMQNAGAVDIDEAARRRLTMPPSTDRGQYVSESPDVEISRPATVGGLPLLKHSSLPTDSSFVNHEQKQAGRAVASDAIATESDFTSFQDGLFELRERVERLVVTKNTRVIEEISVDKSVAIYSEAVTEILKGTEVDVARMPESEPAQDAKPAR